MISVAFINVAPQASGRCSFDASILLYQFIGNVDELSSSYIVEKTKQKLLNITWEETVCETTITGCLVKKTRAHLPSWSMFAARAGPG